MLSHEIAIRVVNAAVAEATALGISGSVAVVDSGGNLKAFCRMEGAVLGSVDGAIRKANTGAVSGMSTAAWFETFSNNPTFGAIVAHGTSGMLFLPGGEPIPDPSRGLTGGVGFAGGMPDQDAAVVKAALAVLEGA